MKAITLIPSLILGMLVMTGNVLAQSTSSTGTASDTTDKGISMRDPHSPASGAVSTGVKPMKRTSRKGGAHASPASSAASAR